MENTDSDPGESLLGEGGRIRGVVSDFDGHPLVGVCVEAVASGGGDLDQLPAMTDGDGRFLLEGLKEARYDLRFAIGRVAARTLGVPTGTENLAVQLARPQGILLIARAAEGADALPDLLHVKLEREGKSGPLCEYHGRHVTSRMLLWSVRPGRYRVTVWGGDWLPVVAHGVQVVEGRPAPEVQMLFTVRGGVVTGRVLESDGSPAGHALVAWRPLGTSGPWPLRERALDADADGAFTVAGLPPGRYLVSAGRHDGRFRDEEIEIRDPAEAVSLALRLP